MIGWICTQAGDPSLNSILNADIQLASELGSVETAINQVFKHGSFEAPIKGASINKLWLLLHDLQCVQSCACLQTATISDEGFSNLVENR